MALRQKGDIVFLMICALTIERPGPLLDIGPAELSAHIDQVRSGQLPGFVVGADIPDAFDVSVRYAQEVGLVGGINETTMTFNYDATIASLAIARAQMGLQMPVGWEKYGVTSLHADGEEGDEMLSISRVTLGAYVIQIFDRGPAVANDLPVELWETPEDENLRILLDNSVDNGYLLPDATFLEVNTGDTVVFNPSSPHMGVTTQAPRRVDTTFFSRLD